MRTALTVYLKELRDSFRDRRTIINALIIGPLLGPAILGIIFSFLGNAISESNQKPYSVVVVHPARAPNLVNRLTQSGMKPITTDSETDAVNAVVNKKQTIALIIPEHFASRLEAGETAEVQLVYDSSRDTLDTGQRRLEDAIRNYSGELGSLRLMLRGIAPEVARPIVIATRDLATPSSRAGQILRSLPYFLILSIFLGGMFLAIDSTAGERERQSLEPLFTLSVPRESLLAGKLLAVMTCSLTSMALSLSAISVMTHFLPLNKIGVTIELDSLFAVKATLCLLPLVFCIGAVELLVASYAQGFRQAQSYLGFIQIIVIVPGAIIMSLPVNLPEWIYTIPVISQQMMLVKFLGNSSPPIMMSIIGEGATLAVGALAFYLGVRLFKGERLAMST